MDAASQLILRNRHLLSGGQVLLSNAGRDTLFRQLAEQTRQVSLHTQDFAVCRWLRASGAEAGFGVLPDPAGLPGQVVLFQPREKDRLEMMLHFFATSLPQDGTLWLVGENRAGIKSCRSRLAKYFERSEQVDAARHCTLFRARSPLAQTAFSLAAWEREWSLGDGDRRLELHSLPGVFAHGRLDPGSALLLDYLLRADLPGGSVLDFGCGIGVIGMSLLQAHPDIRLTLLDNSALALESARASLAANHLQTEVLPSDGLSEVRQRYDLIVSNPPFHRGIVADLAVAREFFAGAVHCLEREGRMLLVCNRHLPYEDMLDQHFGKLESPVRDAHFKILEASQPRQK